MEPRGRAVTADVKAGSARFYLKDKFTFVVWIDLQFCFYFILFSFIFFIFFISYFYFYFFQSSSLLHLQWDTYT